MKWPASKIYLYMWTVYIIIYAHMCVVVCFAVVISSVQFDLTELIQLDSISLFTGAGITKSQINTTMC